MSDLREPLCHVLRQRFHGVETTPVQRRIIAKLVGSRSLLLVAATKATSSLCWQVAAALRGGRVLVVASTAHTLPHRAERLAHEAALVACSLDADHRGADALHSQVQAGHYDVVLVSVRQLGDPRVRRTALASRPWLVVIEDADRCSVHGRVHDPSYVRLPRLLDDLNGPVVLALADTASPMTRDDIAEVFDLRDAEAVAAAPARPDLFLEVRNTPGRSRRDAHLRELLREGPSRAVVFVADHMDAERLVAAIRGDCDLPCAIADDDWGDESSARILQRFREGGVRVLVATNTLICDERWPEIPLIVHYALPECLEQYHRQLTSVASTGMPARSVMLYDREERLRLQRAAWRYAPEPGHLLAIYRAAITADGSRLTHRELARITGLQPDGVHIGLEALVEMDALAVAARGDDWIEAEARPLDPTALVGYALRADRLRRARLEQVEQMIAYARTRRCRWSFLTEVLGNDACRSARCDCCDRCTPPAATTEPDTPAWAWPIQAGGFRGEALCRSRGPDHDDASDEVRGLLHALRYDGVPTSASRLGYLMARHVRARPYLRECDVIVPMPPTRPGDDEAAVLLLGTAIGRFTGLTVIEALKTRMDDELRKELSSPTEKGEEVAGTFTVAQVEAVAGRIVLLVDVVFNSEAIMAEAASVLLGAGARDVRLLAAVRSSYD